VTDLAILGAVLGLISSAVVFGQEQVTGGDSFEGPNSIHHLHFFKSVLRQVVGHGSHHDWLLGFVFFIDDFEIQCSFLFGLEVSKGVFHRLLPKYHLKA
jgi:hypothetical protein